MVFSSISFLFLFLPAVLLVYYLVPKKWRNAVLLAFSLFFYYVGEQKLVLLMLGSSLVHYLCALGIERFREKPIARKLLLTVAVLFSLLFLGYYKYADLMIGTFNGLFGTELPLLKIALPIGISFYTFQTMSYTIDVYRGEVKAEKSFLDLAVYVTLFPQLIAGPIVRYETVAAEIHERRETLEKFSAGIQRFCIGLAKKVIFANTLAEIGKLYTASQTHTLLLAWIAAVAVPLQIYFDFSGYSDMAIGLGKMFAFDFPENFNYPMISRSATEFWRRWHMTLGTWFRDYLYIPLGGNRCKPCRRIFNLLVVWFATGLWHGAAYNFVLWGLYYGVLIIAEKYLYGKFLQKSKILSHLYFAVVTIAGFEIFSASSLTDIGVRLRELCGIGVEALTDVQSVYDAKSYFFVLLFALIFALPVGKWLQEKLGHFRAGKRLVAPVCRVACLALTVICTAYLIDGSYNPFLYFRF